MNNKYIDEEVVDIVDYNLKIEHKLDGLDVKAKMVYQNNNPSALNKLIFSLNSGFKISEITQHGQKIDYSRESQVVVIENANIAPGELDSLEIVYSGKPDERTCYLEVDTATWKNQLRPFLLNIDQRYGIVSSDYVLLTRESYWYPVAGVGYGTVDRFKQHSDFANYTIDVETRPRFTAISQGDQIKDDKGNRAKEK